MKEGLNSCLNMKLILLKKLLCLFGPVGYFIGFEMRLTFILMLLIISGCASTDIKLHEEKNINEIAKITTSCNKSCSNTIKSKIGFDHRYELIDGTILEINGQEGTRKVREGRAFNPSIGTVDIEVKAGKMNLC